MHEQNYAVVSLVPYTMAVLLCYFPFGYFGMHKVSMQAGHFSPCCLMCYHMASLIFNTFVYRMNAENANSVVEPFAWSPLNLEISRKPISNQVIKICL